jgi:hypothetical protein
MEIRKPLVGFLGGRWRLGDGEAAPAGASSVT